jgi:hypothetical protein
MKKYYEVTTKKWFDFRIFKLYIGIRIGKVTGVI